MEDFKEFYDSISSTIEKDEQFELMLKSHWKMEQA